VRWPGRCAGPAGSHGCTRCRRSANHYINHHLKLAGRADPLFSDDAKAAIHQASRGYPRAINILAVSALIATYTSNKAIVDLTAAHSAITENTE